MSDAEWWQYMQIISAIVGALCWVAIFVICCRYKKTIIGTILASQQLDEWQMVKTVPVKADAAPTLHPDVQPILTLFPPHDTNGEEEPLRPEQIMSVAFVIIVISISLIGCAIALWHKCRFGSSLLRSCFPLYPVSAYHRGICKADIFVEITRINDCKSIWAQFKQIPVHPTLLKRIGHLNSQHITIFKTCITKYIRVNWEAADVTLFYSGRLINLPSVGTVSLWSSSDLDSIDNQQQYTIRILGRVLDQIYDIPIDTELTLGAMGGSKFQYSEETEPARGQLEGVHEMPIGMPKTKYSIIQHPLNPSAPRALHTVYYAPADQQLTFASPPAYNVSA